MGDQMKESGWQGISIKISIFHRKVEGRKNKKNIIWQG